MINGKHGQGTHYTKMGDDNYPESHEIYLPKLSTHPQKFGILMKKGFFGRL